MNLSLCRTSSSNVPIQLHTRQNFQVFHEETGITQTKTGHSKNNERADSDILMLQGRTQGVPPVVPACALELSLLSQPHTQLADRGSNVRCSFLKVGPPTSLGQAPATGHSIWGQTLTGNVRRVEVFFHAQGQAFMFHILLLVSLEESPMSDHRLHLGQHGVFEWWQMTFGEPSPFLCTAF